MLTEKDYCDYDTCVALKELGFSEPTLAYYHGFWPSKPLLYLVIDEDCMPEDGVNVFNLLSNSNKYKDSKNIDAPTLWEAQKWLREERHLHIEVRWYSNLWYEYEVKEAEGKILAEGSAFKTYEEAQSTAIYMAIEHLKEK